MFCEYIVLLLHLCFNASLFLKKEILYSNAPDGTVFVYFLSICTG